MAFHFSLQSPHLEQSTQETSSGTLLLFLPSKTNSGYFYSKSSSINQQSLTCTTYRSVQYLQNSWLLLFLLLQSPTSGTISPHDMKHSSPHFKGELALIKVLSYLQRGSTALFYSSDAQLFIHYWLCFYLEIPRPTSHIHIIKSKSTQINKHANTCMHACAHTHPHHTHTPSMHTHTPHTQTLSLTQPCL